MAVGLTYLAQAGAIQCDKFLRRDARALHNSQFACISKAKHSRYLLDVEVTALMLSSPSASSPHAQSQSPPQPPVLHSPA